MEILITGGTGLIGSALCTGLIQDHHTVTVVSRKPMGSQSSVKFISWADLERGAFPTPDAVVNLAGAAIAERRWTAHRKEEIVASRVSGTAQLIAALARHKKVPTTFMSASAIGYYGSRPGQVLTESSQPGDDFLARLCVEWESAVLARSELASARRVILRFGHILSCDGGILAKLLPVFRMRAGGMLGRAMRQLSWVHIDDAVRFVLFALKDPRIAGPFNVVSPHPVSNREWTRALAAALKVRAPFPVPGFVLKVVLGEVASAVVADQRVIPERALAAGFTFTHQHLRTALEELLKVKK